jgi:putative redox protein
MKHEATVRWAGKMTFIGRAGTNHLVSMDTTPDFGGDNSATKPLELLLLALGGCTGMDIASLFKKMRVDFSGIEMNLTAERSEEYPNVYTRIDLEYVIYGRGIDEEKVKRAIELSQDKYCSVSAMLRKSCPVNYTWRIAAPE